VSCTYHSSVDYDDNDDDDDDNYHYLRGLEPVGPFRLLNPV
jgi:hypothetical protein